jgi:pimeloyl-ACP methyl ester carboxylesterase
VPSGFTATVEEYRRWLITELERFEQPVHLVGHDWGGAHVVNVAMTRADLLHSWVCDVTGLFDRTTSGTILDRCGPPREPARTRSRR